MRIILTNEIHPIHHKIDQEECIMELKCSKKEANLWKEFAVDSQARIK